MTGQNGWLWLRAVLGTASNSLPKILDRYQTPSAFYEAIGKDNLAGLLTPAQTARLHSAPTQFVALETACRRAGVAIICYDDAAYPERLRRLQDPPCVLFCTGNLDALAAQPAVAIIGSRRPSAYGVQAATAVSAALAEAGVCLVSGLADGLDSEAHRAAVAASAPTIGVLGTPIDKTYPAKNHALRRKMEGTGATISEYAPGEATNPACFLQRNRLIAALSDAVCVVEAREKSGTMNTVEHAERYGCPVFAVPGGIFNEVCTGTNQLLESGRAVAVSSPESLLQRLQNGTLRQAQSKPEAPWQQETLWQMEPLAPTPPKPQPQTVNLSCEAQTMLETLSTSATNFDILATAAGLTTPQALAALMELEMAELVLSGGNGQYKKRTD